MVAYVIAIREETFDPEKLKAYAEKATAAFKGMEFKVRAAYQRFETLEGAAAEGVAILEFPSFEAAQDWYRNPEHQEARALREGHARFRIMIVEGA